MSGRVFFAVAALIAVTACTTDAEAPASSAIQPAAEARPGVRAEIEAVHALSQTVGDFESRLVVECMREHGFTHAVPNVPPAVTFPKTHGFSPAEVSGGFPKETSVPPDPNAAYAKALSPSERKRYNNALFGDRDELVTHTLNDGSGEIGSPSSGCIAEAEATMFGEPGAGAGVMYLAGNLANSALLAAQEDKDMVALDASWSECMTSAGHEGLDEPDAAFGQAQQAGVRVPASVRVAKDSATCEVKVDYASRRLAIEDRYLTGMMDAREGEIVGVRDSLDQAIGRAEAALA